MKSFLLLNLSLGLFLLAGCSNPAGPSSPPQINVLLDASFDSAGYPSLSGFQYGYPIYGLRKTSFSYSSDVPNSQAIRSLKVFPPDSFASVMRVTLIPEQPTQWKQFRLVYWHKSMPNSFYDVGIGFYSGNTEYFFPSSRNLSTWTQDTITYSANETQIDSIAVTIAMFAPPNVADTINYTLFSAITLKEFY